MSEKVVESKVLNAFGVDKGETDPDADKLAAETMALFYDEYAKVDEQLAMAKLAIGKHMLKEFFDNEPKRVEEGKFSPYKDKSWQKVRIHADWPWKSETAMRNLLRLAVQDRYLSEQEYVVDYTKVNATHLTLLLRVPEKKLDEKIKLLDKIKSYDKGVYPTAQLNQDIKALLPKPAKWTRPSELLKDISTIKNIFEQKFTETFLKTVNQDVDELSPKQKNTLTTEIDDAIEQFKKAIADLNTAKKALRYKKPKPKHEDKPQPGMAA